MILSSYALQFASYKSTKVPSSFLKKKSPIKFIFFLYLKENWPIKNIEARTLIS